ncbi:hypothetical protein GW915_04215 [bacterium]|nr:hypothetical protein [bacterium]
MSRLLAKFKTLNLIEEELRTRSIYEEYFNFEIERIRSHLCIDHSANFQSRLKLRACRILDLTIHADRRLHDLIDIFEELLTQGEPD